jgi:hypothetical protein
LDEVETALFDAAFEAKRLKIAPIEEQYNRVVKEATTRYEEAVLRILKRHGLTAVPKIYNIDLRDKEGNLLVPGKFHYLPDQAAATKTADAPAPAAEKKVKPWEKLKGQKHGPKR